MTHDFADHSIGSNIVRFSDTEFIKMQESSLDEYNTKTSKWEKIIHDNHYTFMTDQKEIAFDTANNQIYLASDRLKIFDLSEKSFTY